MSSYQGCHMYNEEDDTIVKPATDVFEINDFTAATEWENFIDDIENVLRNWQICNLRRSCRELERNDFISQTWKCRKEKLDFYNFPFWICHYRLVNTDSEEGAAEVDDIAGEAPAEEEEAEVGKEVEESVVATDLLSSAGDFCPLGPPAALLWGLRECLAIQPSGEDTLGNDTRARMVVGAVNIALHNTGCPLPCLVQVMEPGKELYTGTAIASNIRTDFSSVCLSRRPAHCGHLSGLLELYRNRLHQPLPVELGPARVSVRLSHRLEDWARHQWTVQPPDLQLYSLSGDTDFVQLASLPFGCPADPVSGLTLHATWRDLSEELVTDTEVHSDLEPLEAPEWSVEVSLADRPDCLLARHLDSFLQLCADRRDAAALLGEVRGEVTGLEGVPGVLDRMGGRPAAASSLSEAAGSLLRRAAPAGGPLQPGLLALTLGFLFPDSDPAGSPHQYPDSLLLPAYAAPFYDVSGPKTAPYDSLTWRLGTAAACCLQWAGPAGVAHLVHEVCSELRYRWESSVFLPGLPLGPPDHAQGLLHQKLQLLNCCIGRRLARDQAQGRGETVEEEDEVMEVQDSDTDPEEFFECEEERPAAVAGPELAAWERPEGREGRVGTLRLLAPGGDWLYRPRLQEPAPLTEDQLAEQAEVMMQLGSDKAGAEVRARMQSASLLSDMESFKAANPGCVLADLVRWHSPRDWTEEAGLSGRMRAEGNLWAGLWEQARAVPARRQRRLFDDTREAERVVAWLAGLGPGDLAQLLLPLLLQAAHLRLLEASPEEGGLADQQAELAGLVGRLSRLQCLPEVQHFRGRVEVPEFEARCQAARQAGQLVRRLEQRVAQALSLRKKFLYDLSLVEEGEEEEPDSVMEMERFVRSLGQGGEVRVVGAARGPAGRLLQSMFRESEQEEHPRPSGLPPPAVRQFVLRSSAGRPLPYSRPGPQRLYCRIGPGEFRLAGAFSTDRQYC